MKFLDWAMKVWIFLCGLAVFVAAVEAMRFFRWLFVVVFASAPLVAYWLVKRPYRYSSLEQLKRLRFYGSWGLGWALLLWSFGGMGAAYKDLANRYIKGYDVVFVGTNHDGDDMYEERADTTAGHLARYAFSGALVVLTAGSLILTRLALSAPIEKQETQSRSD